MFNPAEHFMQLKGKDYLQVMWRLVWFRDEHPTYCIETDIVTHDPVTGAAVFKAVIKDDKGATLATAHGSETKRDFGDYLEKAETKALGRALAYLGYGTQFAPELDEGERIVDSPVEARRSPVKPAERLSSERVKPICERCGKAVTETIGKDGNTVSVFDVVKASKMHFNAACYCAECQKAIKAAAKNNGAVN